MALAQAYPEDYAVMPRQTHRYRTRREYVEAYQWTETLELSDPRHSQNRREEWPSWLKAAQQKSFTSIDALFFQGDGAWVRTESPRGPTKVNNGDWIIHMGHGILKVLPDFAFNMYYEKVIA